MFEFNFDTKNPIVGVSDQASRARNSVLAAFSSTIDGFDWDRPVAAATVYQYGSPDVLLQRARLESVSVAPTTTVTVNLQDSLDCARALCAQYQNVAVLNMANFQQIGGLGTLGFFAQEEMLCITTDVYQSLLRFGQESGASVQDGLPTYAPTSIGQMDVLYSRNRVLKTWDHTQMQTLPVPEGEPVNLHVISCAALKRESDGRFVDHQGQTTLGVQYASVMQGKMRTILQCAYQQGCDAVVLSALGCGMFGNDPEHIAQLFKQVLAEEEFRSRFAQVAFAVLGDAYAVFERAFSPEPSSNKGFFSSKLPMLNSKAIFKIDWGQRQDPLETVALQMSAWIQRSVVPTVGHLPHVSLDFDPSGGMILHFQTQQAANQVHQALTRHPLSPRSVTMSAQAGYASFLCVPHASVAAFLALHHYTDNSQDIARTLYTTYGQDFDALVTPVFAPDRCLIS